MVYSGAYFSAPDMTLEEAQRAKLHYVCRKLWLRPGETVVEVGGGWGALALLMARDYGVTVKSFNISRSQIHYARRRAKAEGLDSRVEFIEDDYRNITGRFDALVSLGMLEHVGRRHYREFGRMMDRCLGSDRPRIDPVDRPGPGGRDQRLDRAAHLSRRLSADAPRDDRPVRAVGLLDSRRRKPAAALCPNAAALARTFRGLGRTVAAMFDERFVRMWRLYLAGSCAAFTGRSLQLFQVVFARPA